MTGNMTSNVTTALPHRPHVRQSSARSRAWQHRRVHLSQGLVHGAIAVIHVCTVITAAQVAMIAGSSVVVRWVADITEITVAVAMGRIVVVRSAVIEAELSEGRARVDGRFRGISKDVLYWVESRSSPVGKIVHVVVGPNLVVSAQCIADDCT